LTRATERSRLLRMQDHVRPDLPRGRDESVREPGADFNQECVPPLLASLPARAGAGFFMSEAVLMLGAKINLPGLIRSGSAGHDCFPYP
jgi:hypothetical protein